MFAPPFSLLLALAVQAGAPPKAQAAQQQAKTGLLLRGATLHSMLPGDAPRVADLWIDGGRIRAIGEEATSAGAPRALDLQGKHVLPGLIDAHVNFDPAQDALYIAAGVTLVRDVGGDHTAVQRERPAARRDRVPGPALLSAGAYLDGDPPASAMAVVLRTPDSAVAYLPILLEEGIDFLSVLPGLPDEVWRKVIELAHEKELDVFGPRRPGMTLAAAIAAGQDGFHSLDSLLPPGVLWSDATATALDESVAELARSRKSFVPLLHASALRLEDQADDPAWRALLGLLGPSYEPWWRTELEQRRPFLAPERRGAGELSLAKQARALRALFDAGAQLVPGSAAPQPWCLPGIGLHQELSRWVQAGVPSSAALELATRGAAEALGVAGERGTLAVGMVADLIVLDQDPREDLGRLLDPAWVVVRGRALARAELQQRLAELGTRNAGLRDDLARAVEVAPPPQGEDGAVVLEGTVESHTFGMRVSTERYRVVRLPNGAVLFSARVLHAPVGGGNSSELTLEQFVQDGRLAQVHARLQEGEDVLEHDGLWTANSWRMQTRMNGRVVNTPPPFREQPLCVEAGSVTALLILGQTAPEDTLPIVQLHPGFDAELVNWRLELDEQKNHKIRTQLGYIGFRLDSTGALEFALTKVGSGVVETRPLSSSTFGGPGFPVPASKRGTTPVAPRGGG